MSKTGSGVAEHSVPSIHHNLQKDPIIFYRERPKHDTQLHAPAHAHCIFSGRGLPRTKNFYATRA